MGACLWNVLDAHAVACTAHFQLTHKRSGALQTLGAWSNNWHATNNATHCWLLSLPQRDIAIASAQPAGGSSSSQISSSHKLSLTHWMLSSDSDTGCWSYCTYVQLWVFIVSVNIWGQQPCIDKNRVLLTFIFRGSQDHCLNFAKSSTEEYNSALSAIKMTHKHTQKCQARIILPHAAHAWLSRPLILPGLMLQYTTTFHNEGCFWHQRRQLAFNRVPSVCEQAGRQAGRQVCCIKRNVLQQCTSEELLSLQCVPLQVLQGSLMVLSLSAI